ncbi:MAG: hypothetical protein Q8Q88_00495 [Phenylobacterium sp.]|uniref:hypothetical protein n=1 Tax=Phenylobacterium sp. TaxID=1871053 RepID=UPI0027333C1F|nr:hypothetical protein [Phenylobacterium sp.]MDP3745502.1 hypothetical protein [Phenylobacterium sp.]
MTDGRWWLALTTFERDEDEQQILPDWAHGASGWMVALAPDEDAARRLFAHDLQHHGLRAIEIDKLREVFSDEEIEEVDDHLAENFRDFERGKSTVWGTLHCYKGEREA